MTREKKKKRMSAKHWKLAVIQRELLKKLKITLSRSHQRGSQIKRTNQLVKCRRMTVPHYLGGVEDIVIRVMKSYNLAAASKPYTTLRII